MPALLEDSGLGDYVIERLNLQAAGRDLQDWRRLVDRMMHPHSAVKVAVVGKYVELRDAYLSVKESLIHAGAFFDTEVEILWVHLESEPGQRRLGAARRPRDRRAGGFGERGIEGKILAARYARESNIPYLGLCLRDAGDGRRSAAHRARHRRGELDRVRHSETPYPVISLLSEQRGIDEKGGTMRLGAYPCNLVAGSKAHAAYGVDGCASATAIATSSTTPSVTSSRLRTVASGNVARWKPGRVVRDARPRLHGRHPVPPGVSLAPDRPHPLFRELLNAAKRGEAAQLAGVASA